ncbi:MAG: tail fiber protein [Pseudomonadota bacterium]|nr:tail fiber protein [Pseudomonadota bacterium]
MSGTNPVGEYLDPNYTTQDPNTYRGSIDACFAVAKRIVDAFAPRPAATPNMTVLLDAGALFSGTGITEVAQQTSPTFTAPVSNPRIDRIVTDLATGALSVIAGTEAPGPTPPAIPLGQAPCAQVYLTVGMSAIINSSITDERVIGGLNQAQADADYALKNGDTSQTFEVAEALDPNDAVPLQQAQNLVSAALLAGTIIDFAGTSAPTGFLACPTSATNISRTAYAALFTAIGTTWGAGDGSTTFGMPWFPADYAAVQSNSNVGTETVGTVIAHSHGIDIGSTGASSGPFLNLNTSSTTTSQISTNTQSPVGGAANLAAGVRIMKCVKY